jgi:hypothetical protein
MKRTHETEQQERAQDVGHGWPFETTNSEQPMNKQQTAASLLPSKCEPGKWHEHDRWGRVLCCGSADLNDWVPAFAVRIDNRTELRFLSDGSDTLVDCEQSW